MSTKNKHRELKKLDRARRYRSHRKAGAAALGAAAGIAAGTQAYAAPVRFDNPPGPGHFDWAILNDGQFLDLTLPAGSQPGTGGASSLRQSVTPTVSSLEPPVQVEIGGFSNLFSIDVPSMTLIPSGAPWSGAGISYIYYQGLGSEIVNGVQTYVGARFNPGDGFHYGWIGVVRTGAELDAFAWGYETTPGVPISAGVPEPGTLALLAFGAASVVARRRRRA